MESSAAAIGGHDGGGSPHKRLFGAFRDWLAASDPAYSRLRFASRALLSLAFTALLLGGLTFFHRMPLAAYGLGVVLAFTGSMAVRDERGRAQFVTRLIAAPIVIASVTVATALYSRLWIDDIALLAVIFGAVYVRKFGPRWHAIGMMSFMAYFMGEYLHPTLSGMSWVALAVVLALAVTHAVTNFLLPDDPERDFRRALVTIDRRVNLILRRLRQSARQVSGGAEEEAREFRRHLARLRDTILMAEGFLPQGAEGSLAAEGPASEVAVALFDLQLVVERLVRSRHAGLPAERLIQAVLDHRDTELEAEAARLESGAEGEDRPSTALLLRLHRARLKLAETLGPAPSPAFAYARENARRDNARHDSQEESGGLVPPSFKTPIQVTLACAIAMGCGLLLSPERWYWAVIAAFIVFNNAHSRGDTALRALQRSGGTLAGLFAGSGVAVLLHGQMGLTLALLVPIFFLAFYFVQISYSLMIFFITIALALVYGLMGMFAPEILLLRLEETIIGALSGTLMAFFVFPKRTSTGAADALQAYFEALRELIETARARVHGEPSGRGLLALSRVLDRRYLDLAAAARPLGGPWSAVTRFGEVRERLLVLSACARWARTLARALPRGGTFAPEMVERIDRIVPRVIEQIAEALERKDSFFERRRRTGGDLPDLTYRPQPVALSSGHPVTALEIISALLERNAVQVGWHDEERPAGPAGRQNPAVEKSPASPSA